MTTPDPAQVAEVRALPDLKVRLRAVFRPHMRGNSRYFDSLSLDERDRILITAGAISEKLDGFARELGGDLLRFATRDVGLIAAASATEVAASDLMPFAGFALWLERFQQRLTSSRDITPRRIDQLCEALCAVIREDRPAAHWDPLVDSLSEVLRALEKGRMQYLLLRDFRRTLEREFIATRILFTAARLNRDSGYLLEVDSFLREASYASFHSSRCLALLLCQSSERLETYLGNLAPALLSAATAVHLSRELEDPRPRDTLSIKSFGWQPERIRQRIAEELADYQHDLQMTALAGAPERAISTIKRHTIVSLEWQSLLA